MGDAYTVLKYILQVRFSRKRLSSFLADDALKYIPPASSDLGLGCTGTRPFATANCHLRHDEVENEGEEFQRAMLSNAKEAKFAPSFVPLAAQCSFADMCI